VRDDWIVDLDGDAVEVHRDPGSRSFGRTERLTRGSTLAPLAFPDVTLSVADLLG
jgi:Uma2 family endonuclease